MKKIILILLSVITINICFSKKITDKTNFKKNNENKNQEIADQKEINQSDYEIYPLSGYLVIQDNLNVYEKPTTDSKIVNKLSKLSRVLSYDLLYSSYLIEYNLGIDQNENNLENNSINDEIGNWVKIENGNFVSSLGVAKECWQLYYKKQFIGYIVLKPVKVEQDFANLFAQQGVPEDELHIVINLIHEPFFMNDDIEINLLAFFNENPTYNYLKRPSPNFILKETKIFPDSSRIDIIFNTTNYLNEDSYDCIITFNEEKQPFGSFETYLYKASLIEPMSEIEWLNIKKLSLNALNKDIYMDVLSFHDYKYENNYIILNEKVYNFIPEDRMLLIDKDTILKDKKLFRYFKETKKQYIYQFKNYKYECIKEIDL